MKKQYYPLQNNVRVLDALSASFNVLNINNKINLK